MLITRTLFHWRTCGHKMKLLTCGPIKLKHQIRCFSLLKQSFITDLSLDIDLDCLKEKQKQQVKLGRRVDIRKMLNNELEEKCAEVISTLPADQSKMLKVLMLEHNIFYAEGFTVPSSEEMCNRNWIEAMTLSSKEERLNYYLFVEHKARLAAGRLDRENENLEQSLEVHGESDKSFIYFEDHNSTIQKWRDHIQASALTHGTPLVFDMEFTHSMTPQEIGSAARQLWFAYCANREHPNPFHFVFTGCPKTSTLYRSLELRYLLNCQHILLTETGKSYIDLFDPTTLVYLSPYAKQVVREIDPNKIYIIGAYADPKNSKKYGPAKAKEQNIQCMKFPIDENIRWIQGTKDLPLPSVVKVLLSLQDRKLWKDAFADALPPKNFKHF